MFGSSSPSSGSAELTLSRRRLFGSVLALGAGSAPLALVAGRSAHSSIAATSGPRAPGTPETPGALASPVVDPVAAQLAARLRSTPFSDKNVAAVVDALAGSGIAVYADAGAPEPLRAVNLPAAPLQFLEWQARTMALELEAGGGTVGADLDAAIPVKSGMPPASFVLAAYAAAVDTPGARMARAVLGEQDWTQAPDLVFPALIPALLCADVVREAIAADSATPSSNDQPGVGGVRALRAPTAGFCSAVQGFINQTISDVFNFLRLEMPSDVPGQIAVSIWNYLVTLGEKAVQGLVKELEAPVLATIRVIAGVAATGAMIATTLRPWAVRIEPAPAATRFAVDAETITGMITARIDLGGLDEWPKDVLSCAETAGVTLPPLKPVGAPVKWTVRESPMPLVHAVTEPSVLDEQASANLTYETDIESRDEAAGEAHQGSLRVVARVKRPELEKLRDALVKALVDQLPAGIDRIVLGILGPTVQDWSSQLLALTDAVGAGNVTVVFHTKKPPTPTAVVTPPADEAGCVVGTWKVVQAPVTASLAPAAKMTGAATLVFRSDGSYSIDYQQLTMTFIIEGDTLAYTFSGHTDGVYAVRDGKLSIRVGQTSESYIVTLPGGPSPAIHPGDLGPGQDEGFLPSHDYVLTCAGDVLSLSVQHPRPGTLTLARVR